MTMIWYCNHLITYNRSKFRSQTFDSIDRWTSRGGKSQRGEAKKWEEQRRERVRRKKMQVREKVGKSRFTVSFQWFVALEGRKVGSLKWRVRSHLARWEMNKLHIVVARSTFPSQNVQSTSTTVFELLRRYVETLYGAETPLRRNPVCVATPLHRNLWNTLPSAS